MHHSPRLARVLTLALAACLMTLTSWATDFTPVAGKYYRIKSPRSSGYLYANGSVVSQTTTKNRNWSQFWKIESSGTGYTFWNPETGTYIGELPGSGNVSLSPTPGVYQIGSETTQDGYTGCQIYPIGSSKGLNISTIDTKLCSWGIADGGSVWVFEETTYADSYDVMQFKNASSGYTNNYLYERDDALFHTAGVGGEDASKWILYPAEDTDTYYLVNYSTGHFIQTPKGDTNVTMGTTPVAFTMERSGDNYLFKANGQYLHRRNYSPFAVMGYASASDTGSQWTVASSSTISAADAQAKVEAAQPMAFSVTTGAYYNIYNPARDNYMYEDYASHNMLGTALNASDYSQVWSLVDNGDGAFYLRNALTNQNAVCSPTNSTQWTTGDTGSAIGYSVTLDPSVSDVFVPYFTIYGNSAYAHMDSQARVVSWPVSHGAFGASHWQFVPADVDLVALDAARAEYAEKADIVDNADSYATHLQALFADYACTELAPNLNTANYASNEHYLALPAKLQAVVDKVANEAWQDYTSGTPWEQYFRITDYRIYSAHDKINEAIGKAAQFTRLSNPTGIFSEGDELIYVMVDKDAPDGASLAIEVVPSSINERNQSGEQTTLHKGLNIIQVSKPSQFYIYYEYDDASETNYIDDPTKNIKIHIEGGQVNGYFDMTRASLTEPASTASMTDRDWTTMLSDGLVTNCERVQLKGRFTLMTIPQKYLLNIPANRTAITPLTGMWNDVVRLEMDMMGYGDNTGKYYSSPNLERRFNSLQVCLGGIEGNYDMEGFGPGIKLGNSALATTLDYSVMSTNGSITWMAAHEYGHNLQKTMSMCGMTEISNNCYSNMILYKLCNCTSRGDAMKTVPTFFAEGRNWLEYGGYYDDQQRLHIGFWEHTQMYWKLYYYFHVLGKDPEFYQKLFSYLRANPIVYSAGSATPASTDYLHFYKACCEAAQADLTDFFEVWGFFRPMNNDMTSSTMEGSGYKTLHEQDGQQCLKVDDYSTYYPYVTDAMITAAKQDVADQHYPNSYPNIIFIDDRTCATYMEDGSQRVPYAGFELGSQGNVGSIEDFRAEATPAGYTYSLYDTGDGTLVTMNGGTGAVGFLVYDASGNLVYLSSFTSFTLPAGIDTGTMVVKAASYDGNNFTVNKAVDGGASAYVGDIILSDGSLAKKGVSYLMRLNRAADRYLYTDASGNLPRTETGLDPNDEHFLWQFESVTGGYVIKNVGLNKYLKHDGSSNDKAGSVTASANDAASATVWVTIDHSVSLINGFKMQLGGGQTYLSNFGGGTANMGTWATYDEGGQIAIEPIPEPTLSLTDSRGVDVAEGRLYALMLDCKNVAEGAGTRGADYALWNNDGALPFDDSGLADMPADAYLWQVEVVSDHDRQIRLKSYADGHYIKQKNSADGSGSDKIDCSATEAANATTLTVVSSNSHPNLFFFQTVADGALAATYLNNYDKSMGLWAAAMSDPTNGGWENAADSRFYLHPVVRLRVRMENAAGEELTGFAYTLNGERRCDTQLLLSSYSVIQTLTGSFDAPGTTYKVGSAVYTTTTLAIQKLHVLAGYDITLTICLGDGVNATLDDIVDVHGHAAVLGKNYYMTPNRDNGPRYLCVDGDDCLPTDAAQATPDAGDDTYLWRFEAVNGGYVIKNVGKDKYLLHDGSTSDGRANVKATAATAADATVWTIDRRLDCLNGFILTRANGSTTYFSNFGGVGSRMGTYNAYTNDRGSQICVVAADEGATGDASFAEMLDVNGDPLTADRLYAVSLPMSPASHMYHYVDGALHKLGLDKSGLTLGVQPATYAWRIEDAGSNQLRIMSYDNNTYINQIADNNGAGGGNIHCSAAQAAATLFTVTRNAFYGNQYMLKTVAAGDRVSTFLSNASGGGFVGLNSGTGWTATGSRFYFTPLVVLNIAWYEYGSDTPLASPACTFNGTATTTPVVTLTSFASLTSISGDFEIPGTTYQVGSRVYDNLGDALAAIQASALRELTLTIRTNVTAEDVANRALASQIYDAYTALPAAIRGDGFVGNYNAADYIDDLKTAIDNVDYSEFARLVPAIGEANTLSHEKAYNIYNWGSSVMLYGSEDGLLWTTGSTYESNPYSPTDADKQWIFHDSGSGTVLYNIGQQAAAYDIEGTYNKHKHWLLTPKPASTCRATVAVTPVEGTPFAFGIQNTPYVGATYSYLHYNGNFKTGVTDWQVPDTDHMASGWLICEVGDAPADALTDAAEVAAAAVPARGNFVRLRGKAVNKYAAITFPEGVITATGSSKAAMQTDVNDNSLFWWDTDGTLINYATGTGLKETSIAAGYNESASFNAFTAQKGSAPDGFYELLSDFSGSKYLYGGKTIDRNSGTHANCYWEVIRVDTLQVTIGSTGYASLCAPIALAIPDGVSAFVGEKHTSYVHLEQVADVIPANTPVVLYTETPATYKFAVTTTSDTYDSNCFSGGPLTKAVTDGDMTLGRSGGVVGFYKYTSTTKPYLTGFKIYIPAATASGIRAFTLSFGSLATGVTDTPTALTPPAACDLSGRRVPAPREGLYIVNGKKVIINK